MSAGVVDPLLARVHVERLLAPGRPVVVMLSGGRDSTCLLDVAVTVAGAGAVTALHVNYGLRTAAEGDERHCRELCARLGVELVIERAGPAPAGNMQAWARELRYDAAARLALAHAAGGAEGRVEVDGTEGPTGADIAAGHTATDQVETILYRLASSPSRRALLGMRPQEAGPGGAGSLVRPLLAFTREQTGAYCRERGLSWRDDETNETGTYARGRVRHGLVPALRAVHPGAEQNVLALAETLREEAEVLEILVEDELAGRDEIALEQLRALPPALARLIVQRLADQVGGGPTPGTARRLAEILTLRDSGTTHLDLPGGVRATAVDGVLRFTRTPAIVRDL